MDKDKKSKHLKELIACEEKMQEYLSGWQRAQADYQNLKKDAAQEKEELGSFIKSQVLQELFPIIDNFEIALKHVPDNYKKESWYQGFVHLNKQLESTFEDLGVKKIKTIHQMFDVDLMEAVKREKGNKIKSGQVIKEVSAGYLLNGKVIVPAKVIVAE